MTGHFTLDVDPDSLKTTKKWLTDLSTHLTTKGGTVATTPEEIGDDWTGTAATSIKGEMTALGEEMKGSYATNLERLAHDVGVLEKAYRHALDEELPALNKRWREAKGDYDAAVKKADKHYDSLTDFEPKDGPPNRAVLLEARTIKSHATSAAFTDLETEQGKIEADYDDLVERLKLRTGKLGTALVEHTPVSVPTDAVKDFQENGAYPSEPLGQAHLLPGLPMSVRDALETVTTDAPAPDDPSFAKWFAQLSPGEKQAYRTTLSWSMNYDGFDPLSEITPGTTASWAELCQTVPFSGNDPLGQLPDGPSPAEVDGRDWGSPIRVFVDGEWIEYGYTGGGSITGPGGAEWPIMMPYMKKDDVTYMDDVGIPREDGGLMQLDGYDPGWSTVSSYRGVNKYMDVSPTVSLTAAVAGLKGNRVYPDALYITPDGTATLEAPPPGEVEYAGTSEATPDTERLNPAGADRWNRMVGGVDLAMAGLQTMNTIDAAASHEQRPWFIEYQINEDGRRRAIVRTYQAGTTDSGHPVVGSFANTFDVEGSSTEIAYARRMNGQITRNQDAPIDTTLGGSSSQREADLDVDLSAD